MSTTLELVAARIAILEEKMNLVIKVVDIDDKNTSKKSKKAKKDNSDVEAKSKTKRVSGYILYSNANRTEVKEKLAENSQEKPKNTDVMKELARMWKELADDEKEVWNGKAKQLKEEALDVA
jgi:hypothetical protein|tara:strand:+ start:1624 stop:1989 length:366 start_codon:yes stop_codon:yes gene_type:complete